MQNDLAKFNDLMDENLRLRGEVRRYRRVLRAIERHELAGFCDYHEGGKLDPTCIERRGDHIDNCDPCLARAALAPRRRKK